MQIRSTTTNVSREVTTSAAAASTTRCRCPRAYTQSPSGSRAFRDKAIEVTLGVSQRLQADFALELGTVSEQVIVEARPAAIETESSDIGQVKQAQEIIDLPLNTRNFTQLVQLAPGVLTGVGGASGLLGYTSGRGTNGAVINGAPVEDVTYLIDGINSVDTDAGVLIFFPPVDSIYEFKVQTSSAPAAYGGGQGIINVTYKSGTNEYHGVAYEFLRNSALDAKNFFDSAKDPDPAVQAESVRLQSRRTGADSEALQRQRPPLLLLRLRRQTRAAGANLSEHRSDRRVSHRRLLFAAAADDRVRSAHQPAHAAAGQHHAAGAINPISARMIELYPEPNLPGEINNFLYNPVQTNRVDQTNTRIDYRTSNSSIFGRYSWEDADTYNPGNLPEPAIGAGPGRPGQCSGSQQAGCHRLWARAQPDDVLRFSRRLFADDPGHLRFRHEIRQHRGRTRDP